MAELNQDTRHTFITSDKKDYELAYAPINADSVEQDIKRSEKSDGIVLNITQGNQFIKDARDFLVNRLEENGVVDKIKFRSEKKEFNAYVIENESFVSLHTLKHDKTKATVDFIDTEFDEKLRSNFSEEFEFDRITDIDGNAIDPLKRERMIFKNRQILLRSELEETTNDEYSDSNTEIFFAPIFKTIVSSDILVADVFPNTDNEYWVDNDFGDVTKCYPEEQQFFYYRNDRPKTLKLEFDLDFDIKIPGLDPAYDNFFLSIQKSTYTEGLPAVPVELIDIHEWTGTADGGIAFQNFTFNNAGNPYEIDLDVDECLCYVIRRNTPFNGLQGFIQNKDKVVITEDSFYLEEDPEDRAVDCISLYDAFKRVIQIIDPEVIFKSDFIEANYNDIALFSGETARHVLLEDTDTGLSEKVVLGTTSFDKLFKFLFTVVPVAFGIRKIGAGVILEIEEVDYFFDRTEFVDLGVMKDIKRSVNAKKIYSSIKIGYNKSGENEAVYGLQATHTTNIFTTPSTKTGVVYDASCDFRTDPTELEMCYRLQYRRHPDTDTKYDKDIFAVDCISLVVHGLRVYVPNIWENHFAEQPKNIYSPDTAYNYRLTNMNCLLRHGKNFKQEFYKTGYINKSILYASTNGNSKMITKLIGGVERPEDGSVLISDLEDPLFTTNVINGSSYRTNQRVKDINGGIEKQNYYKTVIFTNQNGNKEKGFVSTIKIKDDIKVELLERFR